MLKHNYPGIVNSTSYLSRDCLCYNISIRGLSILQHTVSTQGLSMQQHIYPGSVYGTLVQHICLEIVYATTYLPMDFLCYNISA